MTEDFRVPARQSGEGREWPRMKPVFSVLAVMLPMRGGACQFAYQFKTHWTPLQRLYFPTFFETAHLAHAANRNLRPPRSVSLLLVAFPRGVRLAVDNDLTQAPLAPGEPAHAPRLLLSSGARQAGATRLSWQSLRFSMTSPCTLGSHAQSMANAPSGNSGATPGTPASSCLPSCSHWPSVRTRPTTDSDFSDACSRVQTLPPAPSFIGALAIIPGSASEPRRPRVFGSFCG